MKSYIFTILAVLICISSFGQGYYTTNSSYKFNPESDSIFVKVTDWGSLSSQEIIQKKIHIDNVITGLKETGYWDKLDVLYIFTAESQQMALIDWRKPTRIATNHNCVFTPSDGFKGGLAYSNSYINTNYNVLTDAVNYKQNDANVSLYIKEFGAVNANPTLISCDIAPFNQVSLGLQKSMNGNSSAYISGDNWPSETPGLWSVTRRNSTSYVVYKAIGDSVITTNTSVALSNNTIQLLGTSWNNGFCSNAKISFFFAGASLNLSQSTEVSNIIKQYLYTYNTTPGFYNVKDYGVIGDSLTDNSSAMSDLVIRAGEYQVSHPNDLVTIYFPAGVYSMDRIVTQYLNILFSGSGMYTTKLNFISTQEMSAGNFKHLTLQGSRFTDYYAQNKTLKFIGVRFLLTNGTYSTYMCNWGFYVKLNKIYYDSCVFDYNKAYIGIHAYNVGVDTVIIKNTTFTGSAIHPIRIEKVKYALIDHNVVNETGGGWTGIFIGSQRDQAIENVIVTNNTVSGQAEEGISFDGFGNNTDLCPEIAVGNIVSATNGVGGRLVIETVIKYKTGIHPDDVLDTMYVSDRTDWTNFYYCFSEGTGLEGKYFKIYSYDNFKNTLTVDTICPSSNVTIGGYGSVDAGFFKVTIANNTVHDIWGADSTYGTGLSLWLNCFDFNVYGNNVYNCAHGANVCGGMMLNLYRTKAWRINVHNNSFTNCRVYGINFSSAYDNVVKQYDNTLKNNTFTNSSILIDDQIRFTNEGNVINP